MKRWLFNLSIPAIGAVLGFAYYHYVGCISGTCPITSNGWIMTSYGALIGWLVVPRKKKEKS